MPSKRRQVYYLGIRVAAWLLWLPLTGDLRHGRTYGELRRLRPREVLVLLVPLGCYALVGGWLYLAFPPELYAWAGAVVVTGLVLGGTLVASTVVTAKVADWALVYADR
ncbi:hypothetical protein [Halobacterium yunchengense]|uniref:hypothetical protein n=1 Tax=Halobacterium yunchengense TaxID=3108497 RepID=UPI00300A597F